MSRAPLWPCACGCGELTFNDGAYKKGHKSNPPGRNAVRQLIGEEAHREFQDEKDFADNEQPPEIEWLTIDEAAQNTPDDPPPEPGNSKPEGRPLRITARVRNDVRAKLAWMFTVAGSMAIMTGDGYCGESVVNNADNMADKLTPIFCKSPEMVRRITKGSDFMMYVDAAMAMWPVLAAVTAHHMPGKKAVQVDATMPPQPPDNSQYTVGLCRVLSRRLRPRPRGMSKRSPCKLRRFHGLGLGLNSR